MKRLLLTLLLLTGCGQGIKSPTCPECYLIPKGREIKDILGLHDSQTVVVNSDVVRSLDVSEIIDPCGSQGAYDEVLLRLGNGQIMAHYASGTNQFLTLLSAGNYVTTDGTNCHFTISASGVITY